MFFTIIGLHLHNMYNIYYIDRYNNNVKQQRKFPENYTKYLRQIWNKYLIQIFRRRIGIIARFRPRMIRIYISLKAHTNKCYTWHTFYNYRCTWVKHKTCNFQLNTITSVYYRKYRRVYLVRIMCSYKYNSCIDIVNYYFHTCLQTSMARV